MSEWFSEEELASTPWPRFKGEHLFESLINHYGLDIEDEARFRDWLKVEFGIDRPETIGDPQKLLILFRLWAALDADWVGAYSVHTGFRDFGGEE